MAPVFGQRKSEHGGMISTRRFARMVMETSGMNWNWTGRCAESIWVAKWGVFSTKQSQSGSFKVESDGVSQLRVLTNMYLALPLMSLAKWKGPEDVDNSDVDVAHEVDLSSNEVSLRYGGHANPEWRGWAAGNAIFANCIKSCILAYPQVVSIFFERSCFGNRDQGNCNGGDVKRLPASDFDRCLTWCTSEVFWSQHPKRSSEEPA